MKKNLYPFSCILSVRYSVISKRMENEENGVKVPRYLGLAWLWVFDVSFSGYYVLAKFELSLPQCEK